MSERPRFHLAFPVTDLDATRAFYAGALGARVGRAAARWVDFDLHGHQLSAHLVDEMPPAEPTNPVDGVDVPVRHFGVILSLADFDALAARLAEAGVDFLIPPRTRFAGQAGEQRTLFVRDPSGNALEVKAFADDGQVFATE